MPKDPVILMSYVNTELRDHYKTLDDFCAAEGADKEELIEKLKAINYTYDPSVNQFV